MMAHSIERKMKELKVDQCHLGAYSFAGIDARAAISMYGANEYVKSLTTVCTPHLGCRLIDKSQEDRYAKDDYQENMERVWEILGLTNKSALEFGTYNM